MNRWATFMPSLRDGRPAETVTDPERARGASRRRLKTGAEDLKSGPLRKRQVLPLAETRPERTPVDTRYRPAALARAGLRLRAFVARSRNPRSGGRLVL